jgi:hypothetical protein
VYGGEANFRPRHLEEVGDTGILILDFERELMSRTTYAASWREILQLVLLVPAIAGVRHDEGKLSVFFSNAG